MLILTRLASFLTLLAGIPYQSYSDQLHFLNLPTTTRDNRLFLKLCTMYKFLNNTFRKHNQLQVKVPNPSYVHSPCVCKLIAYSIRSHMNSFVLSTSTLWNGLPPIITCLSTFNTFKNYLITFMFS